MIARIIIPLIIVIVALDLYYDLLWLRRHRFYRWRGRMLWWSPSIIMIVWGAWIALQPAFVPDDISIVNWYLFFLGMVALPKAVAALCSLMGKGIRRVFHSKRRWGLYLATPSCLLVWCGVVYGATAGISGLSVKHIDLEYDDLPDSFDGYRILQFSDAHLGSFNDWRRGFLARDVDSINAQKADLIVFTGDIQNIKPTEMTAFTKEMSSLSAPDGVISILGNHDYSWYTREEAQTEARWRRQTINQQRVWGWQVLLNEHVTLKRGQDSLVVAGEQNLIKPDSADLGKTLRGVGAEAFVVFLQHNPTAWRKYILHDRRNKLTLSGHTHGGQVSLLGFQPASLAYSECYGLFSEGRQRLYVSSGIGALMPFRLGMPPEIVVITLHKRKS